MKAIQFDFTIPIYYLGLVVGKLSPKFFWSGLTCTSYKEVPEPQLPSEDWVKVRTILGGICGSDMSQVKLILTPYYEPVLSVPNVIGHENVGRIASTGVGVRDWQIGDT